jgi:hypothetical protein
MDVLNTSEAGDARTAESTERDRWNGCRDQESKPGGRYESYFVRANHPERPLAFWIRYTIFRPKNDGLPAEGELWAIWFNGETEEIIAAKETMSLARCAFSPERLGAQIGHCVLNDQALYGTARQGPTEISWELTMEGGQKPALLLPENLYDASLPKAKSVVPRPNARFDGYLVVGGRRYEIESWAGSQNHNWGSRHTDHYAFGQVCGFDDAPEAFLECASVKLKIGPVWTPRLTTVLLRLDGREFALTGIRTSLRAKADISYFDWRFETGNAEVELAGHITAPRYRFAGLTYRNPPGGEKTCLNSKLATCVLEVRPADGPPRTLVADQRAAFEILTDDNGHRVPILA